MKNNYIYKCFSGKHYVICGIEEGLPRRYFEAEAEAEAEGGAEVATSLLHIWSY